MIFRCVFQFRDRWRKLTTKLSHDSLAQTQINRINSAMGILIPQETGPSPPKPHHHNPENHLLHPKQARKINLPNKIQDLCPYQQSKSSEPRRYRAEEPPPSQSWIRVPSVVQVEI